MIAVLATAGTAAGALRVTVAPGETLGGIATRHGITAEALARHNGIANPNVVAAGRSLLVPSGVSRSLAISGGGVYVIRPGDTLSGIAARFGTSTRTLARRNGITNPNRLVVGARLRISSSGGAVVRTSAPATGGGSTSSAGVYVVRPGDTLGGIAARLGTSAARLAALNGIVNPNAIAVGTRLRIPGAPVMSGGPLTPVTAATAGWGAHPSKATVRSLMARHAARHGVDPALVRAVGWQESGWWQGARSSTGAIGVMQLMPGTAAWLGPALLGRPLNAYDASDNIEGGVAYLAYLQRKTGSRRLALASYYQGLGSVTSRGLLAETEVYVASVVSFIGRV